MEDINSNKLDIAVIGMSCIFPGAKDKNEFFDNLCKGVNATKFLSDEELIKRGVKKEEFQDEHYVRAVCELDDIEKFDAPFFGIAPKEAISMDPQQRIFLECCYEGLEDAGYVRNDEDLVGVFAGCSMNTYLSEVLATDKSMMSSLSEQQIMIGNDKDFLPTLVSYKLNLKGPSVSINTACSTSLVAIHYARTSLLLGECDVAIAGGVSIVPNHNKGYMYVKDSFQSPDGLCHAFDEEARGTIWGEGCGVVVLKRLEDAQRDKDNILAVIKGSAVNNDGADKVGYTAPSVEGQTEVIAEALAVANVSADQVTYVEAHGTGTPLGDVIEIEALSKAFSEDTTQCNYCRIGSVKPNIGHLGSAAGIAGFVKAVLSINKRRIPPSINYRTANKNIHIEKTPFKVNNELYEYEHDKSLIFGVSSMGIGGTNCHVVLESPPKNCNVESKTVENAKTELFLFSAKSEKALSQLMDNYATYFEKNSDLNVEDVAYTLQCGREFFSVRKAFYCNSIAEAKNIINELDCKKIYDKSNIGNLKDDRLAKWLQGEEVDWCSSFQERQVVKKSLPTYPFDKKRFWVDSNPQEEKVKESQEYYIKQKNMNNWFYAPVWKQTVLQDDLLKEEKQTYWVFNDKLGYGTKIINGLREQGHQVIAIEKGASFNRNSNEVIIMNPSKAEDYKELVCIHQEINKLPDKIIYCWGIEPVQNKINEKTILRAQKNGVFGIIKLVKSINNQSIQRYIKVYTVMNNLFSIIGDERLNVSASTMIGMSSVIQQEYENIDCSLIDINLEENEISQNKLIINLINELQAETTESVCGFRNNKRYIKCFDTIKNREEVPLQNYIRNDKSYLVFNCLEGVGLSIVKHIMESTQTKVLILGEKGFPEKNIWDKLLSEDMQDIDLQSKLLAVKELEKAGAFYVSPIDELNSNQEWLSQTEHTYGRIEGIIYTGEVGILSRGQITDFDEEIWGTLLLSMYSDIQIIDKIFEERKLSFKILINGLVSILGGLGSGGVSALLNFLKAYCIQQNQSTDRHWNVQCWDGSHAGWENIKDYISTQMYEVIEQIALKDEEVDASFDHSLHFVGLDEIAISATELNTRYDRWGKANINKKSYKVKKQKRMESLSTVYEPPITDMEKKIEEIVSDLLGIEGIGMEDDFFELGGHSLLGVQMLSKLSTIYHVDLDLPVIYQCPTIKKIEQYISTLTNK